MKDENMLPQDGGGGGGCSSHDSLQRQLMRVMRTLVFRTQPHPALSDLPIMQVRCLHVIRKEEGQKMHDLADKLEATLPAMSQIVDRLVKRAMVERRADPSDRRVVRLHLTDEARTALEEARISRDERLEATLAHLAPEEQAQIQEALRLLADAAERAAAEEPSASRAAAASATAQGDSADSLTGGDALVEMLARRARAARGNGSSSSSAGRHHPAPTPETASEH